MIPYYRNLSACVGRGITWNVGNIVSQQGGARQAAVPIGLETDGGAFALTSEGDDGLWIPYIKNTATYAFADAGVHWAGTGPFSGCKFEVGNHGGRVYAAHIAVEEGGLDASGDLERALPGRTPLKTFRPTGVKIGAMMGEGFEGIIFVVWSGEAAWDASQVIYNRADMEQKIVNVTRIRL